MRTVSIIVPVYNAERYIDKCIQSIINQTYKNIEIILVDDGSTDNSNIICKQYEKIHDNLKLISTENRGVSCARNTGIESSSGKYIMFVDSDDYIDNDMIEKMLQKVEENNYDLCICNYVKEYIDKQINIECFGKDQVLNNEEINHLIIDIIERSDNQKEHLLAGVRGPCCKLYSKEIIDKYDIRFNNELIIGEDFIFNLDYLAKCSSVSIINKYYYHYVTNMNSATMKYKDMCWSGIYKKIILCLITFLKCNDLFEEGKERVDKLIIKYFFMCIYNEMSDNNTHNLKYKLNQIKYMCNDEIIRKAIYNFKGTYVTPKEKMIITLAKYKAYYLIYPLVKIKIHN